MWPQAESFNSQRTFPRLCNGPLSSACLHDFLTPSLLLRLSYPRVTSLGRDLPHDFFAAFSLKCGSPSEKTQPGRTSV